jgi:osmotically-inducible protein OsmY
MELGEEMKLDKTRALLGTALIVFSTYGFAATTTDEGDGRQIVITGDADTQIRAEVMQRINERPVLRFANIDVQSFHHDVYLNGLVDTGTESAQAEAIARSVPGVRNVYNGLGLNGNGG